MWSRCWNPVIPLFLKLIAHGNQLGFHWDFNHGSATLTNQVSIWISLGFHESFHFWSVHRIEGEFKGISWEFHGYFLIKKGDPKSPPVSAAGSADLIDLIQPHSAGHEPSKNCMVMVPQPWGNILSFWIVESNTIGMDDFRGVSSWWLLPAIVTCEIAIKATKAMASCKTITAEWVKPRNHHEYPW